MIALTASSAPSLHDSDDRSFFLDCRRQFRLRRADPGWVAAIRRDGASHRLRWPDAEALPASEKFAKSIWEICEKAAGTP